MDAGSAGGEMAMKWTFLVLLTAALAVGCGDDDGPAEDDPGTDMGGSSGSDLGTSPGEDLGTTPADDLGTTPEDDMGTTPEEDMGSTGDPDAGSSAGTIDCGDMTCDAATQECCASFGGGSASFTCITAGDACSGGTAECDGPEDCAGGEVCCGMGGGGGVTVECTTDPCEGFSSFEMCHTPADCTTPTHMCCPIMMFGISGGVCREMCGFGP